MTEPHDIGKDLRLESTENKLMYVPNKVVAKDVGIKADVYTFVAHPADLLTIAEVFRRELMPVVTADNRYQRPLDFKKLKSMRKLVMDRNFAFPNSILISLDEKCSYDMHEGVLRIPMIYGSVSIIDGQHRLFSYASCDIPDEIREEAEILVTALRFQTSDPGEALQSSARAFIEINQEQKRVSSDHISEIAYSVLGQKYPRALAAQVILRCNHRGRKALYGMFNSSQVTGGIFKAATAIDYLAGITNLETIGGLVLAKGRKKARVKLGYINLFGKDPQDLLDAETVIEHGVICLEQYFSHVKHVFRQDWPERDDPKNTKGTTLAYTKVFSAFIKLLGQFIQDGLDWIRVEQELNSIRKNVLSKRGLSSSYRGVVFAKGVPEIPDDQPSVSDTFKFLNKNRSTPTSISEI